MKQFKHNGDIWVCPKCDLEGTLHEPYDDASYIKCMYCDYEEVLDEKI